MQMGEVVTWQAKHFGIRQKLTVHITAFKNPYYFTDEMLPGKGAFKAMKHQHLFKEQDGAVVMTDVFEYKSPLGILGKLADVLFLKRYMHNFLKKRNTIIRAFAEDPAQWQKVPGMV
jgi:ligand-binding SRPBCC domain-containing protein